MTNHQIWTLIVKYHLCPTEGQSPKQELLNWVTAQIPSYEITNFTSNWRDGRAMYKFAFRISSNYLAAHSETLLDQEFA